MSSLSTSSSEHHAIPPITTSPAQPSREPGDSDRLASYAKRLFGTKADETLDAQIAILASFRDNSEDVDLGRATAPTFTPPPQMLAHNTVLCFQCDDKIAAKIDHLENEHDAPLVKREAYTHIQKGKFHIVDIWNTQTQDYDSYHEILSERDPDTGFQAAAYYDLQHKRLAISFGGTDFTNPRDMFVSGAQMVAGVTDNRMTRAIPFTSNAIQSFTEQYNTPLSCIDVDLFGHSMGARAVPLASYALQREYGITPRSQGIIEATGHRSAVQIIAEKIARHEKRNETSVAQELSDDVTHYKAAQGSFIDKHRNMAENCGTIVAKQVDGNNAVTAHMGATWIRHFNNEAKNTSKNTIT